MENKLTTGESFPPITMKPIGLSFSFGNSIVVSFPILMAQSFGSFDPSGSFGFSGSLGSSVEKSNYFCLS